MKGLTADLTPEILLDLIYPLSLASAGRCTSLKPTFFMCEIAASPVKTIGNSYQLNSQPRKSKQRPHHAKMARYFVHGAPNV
ncbi:MAG: hypothetical protein H7224_00870 [Polaromonas sp.]|nr:hypothetical protein [Polaromonas sp.]